MINYFRYTYIYIYHIMYIYIYYILYIYSYSMSFKPNPFRD